MSQAEKWTVWTCGRRGDQWVVFDENRNRVVSAEIKAMAVIAALSLAKERGDRSIRVIAEATPATGST